MMMLLEGGIARKSRSRLIDNHSGTVLKALHPGLFPANAEGVSNQCHVWRFKLI
jgi:hypothetical protein